MVPVPVVIQGFRTIESLIASLGLAVSLASLCRIMLTAKMLKDVKHSRKIGAARPPASYSGYRTIGQNGKRGRKRAGLVPSLQ